MKYIVEFYYGGEVIERREYNEFFIAPNIGDIVRIQFTNPTYYELGSCWIVMERRLIMFSVDQPYLKQLMLNIKPDPNNGVWKTDPLYGEN
jgi:hypothetical protein